MDLSAYYYIILEVIMSVSKALEHHKLEIVIS